MQFFEEGKVDLIKNKILKDNEERKLLTDLQTKNLEFVCKVVSETGQYHSSKIYKADLEMLD